MTTETNTPPRRAAPPTYVEPLSAAWHTPPWTLEERLQRIGVLAQRISGYVQFMCQVGNLNGTSGEAKERAVAAFYERMAALERQLARIQEDLQLG